MSKEALKLIEENQRTKATTLHLDFFLIDELPSELADCIWLEELSISNNNLVDLSLLSNLSNLLKLDCNGTQINDLTPLAQLPNLQSLDCSNTQVGDVPFLSYFIRISSCIKLISV